MVKNNLYVYDETTKKLVNEFPSFSAAEREFCLRNNWFVDYFRGKAQNRLPYLYSRIKADEYPESILVSKREISKEMPKKEEEVKKILPPSVTLSEDQLRKKHDMYYMIFTYLRQLKEKQYIEETQMLRDLGLISKPRLRDALNRPELKEYRGKADGVIYYGQPGSIKHLKSEGILQ